jgi:hypothetical protein
LKGLKLEEGLKLEANRAVMDEGIQDEENDDMDEVNEIPFEIPDSSWRKASKELRLSLSVTVQEVERRG